MIRVWRIRVPWNIGHPGSITQVWLSLSKGLRLLTAYPCKSTSDEVFFGIKKALINVNYSPRL